MEDTAVSRLTEGGGVGPAPRHRRTKRGTGYLILIFIGVPNYAVPDRPTYYDS
jgi:hypothetical protein